MGTEETSGHQLGLHIRKGDQTEGTTGPRQVSFLSFQPKRAKKEVCCHSAKFEKLAHCTLVSFWWLFGLSNVAAHFLNYFLANKIIKTIVTALAMEVSTSLEV